MCYVNVCSDPTRRNGVLECTKPTSHYQYVMFLHTVMIAKMSISSNIILCRGPARHIFEDVFVFLTGGDALPLFGFDKQPIIEFYSEPGRLPMHQLALRLFRYLAEYAEFKEIMRESILGSAGFGNV